MVDIVINCANPEEADALLVGVPYERDASFGGGTKHGPRAILASLDHQVELFERHTRTEPARRYRIAQRMLNEVDVLRPDDMVVQVADVLLASEAFTILLGGTHAVSIGAFRAHAVRGRTDDVTVLQIDAHLDLRDDDSDYNDQDPSRCAHSCVMRRAHEMGFRTCAVGTRTYSRLEYRYALEEALPMFEWGRGAEPSIEAILGAISTERVYLTIDIDGFDPAVAPATGTPVPGGLSWDYGTRLVRELFRTREVIGADIVEVAPIPGSVLTEYAAAQLCYDMLCYKLLKRDGRLAFV
jgi:agmatinase